MHHIVCYSGGESSAIVAIEVVKKYGSANVILINHDIHGSVEHWDIKRFKQEVAQYLNLNITQVNMQDFESKDQFDVCIEAKALKINHHPLCTNRLKTAPFHHWLEKEFPVLPGTCRSDITIYYGFEAGETSRIERRRRILGEKGYRTCFPLEEWKDVLVSTHDIGINPPVTYSIWKHANCIGCLRAGQQHWYAVFCLRKDIWEKAKYAEQVIGYSILRVKNKPVFLKDFESKFLTMQRLGIRAEEKTSAHAFWAAAKKILGSQPTEEKASCGF